jgi:type 1 glutamine amidotransferase
MRAVYPAVCPMSAASSYPHGPIRIALVTASAGYVHASIPTAQRVFRELAERESDLTLPTILGDVADLDRLTAAMLAQHDLLCFVHNGGDLPLDRGQKQALLDFVGSGKGFVGIHSASTAMYDWDEYRELIGAHFLRHPPGQTFTVEVENREHPSTRHLPPTFEVTDEPYTFRTAPREVAQILLRAEAGTAGLEGDLPLAWIKSYREGRVYYNALGHYDAYWDDPAFQAQLVGGMRWAAGRAE